VLARLTAGLVVVLMGASVFVADSSGAGSVDITGTWNCCGTGGAAASILQITDSGGTISGDGTSPAGEVYTGLSGTVTGRSFRIVETYNSFSPGYVATFVGSVSADAKTMSGSWSSNAGQSGTFTAARVTPPVAGKSVVSAPVSGQVLVELPGKTTFTAESGGHSLPVGTTVDTTHGEIALTAAAGGGRVTHGKFYDGEFRITQHRAGSSELSVLTLTGSPASCAADDARTARAQPKKRLWGNATGNFQTVARYAAATERGTKWLTEDSCAGTLVQVTQGEVSVDDFAHHRTFTLTAPHSFLAHPGAGG
jgi:hypothetical protein